MTLHRSYRPGKRADMSAQTRQGILRAVRELLAEGRFHQSTVEEVAKRAGVSRATLYQHFRSRLGLVDAMCETFDVSPALIGLRRSVIDPDPRMALDESIANLSKFWEGEETILQQLYGVAAIDEAAQDLVRRQTEDRRSELKRLLGTLKTAGSLRHDLTDKEALTHLMVLTSFEAYEELRRRVGMSQRHSIDHLQRTARRLLLPGSET